ncbi:PIN domain-containing protein [Leptospira gomenensis]|uniref:PIN domain-containing protein n=1 Tax=Leptospira gomenensis TaxID=2484974 RepID=A0A5F1Y6E8_9LEPT|nr:PIN domain-containing protein [Leptospira gomenensis]TGK27541.1 PIN domain-containing protein [Leptospira gomenensis]TGK42622.1 PIN domain-containing protein [Leptospira gomenensis]TGK65785.1 PIN domain-containing protein [Leptospira gomenensis]
MVLVDTSIWIEFFKRKEPYFSELRDLIESSEVIVHEVIFGELLQGCKSKLEVSFILEYWENLNTLTAENSFLEAGKLSYDQKLKDKGVGLIDSVIINEAMKRNLKLWTLDKKILKVLSPEKIFHSK